MYRDGHIFLYSLRWVGWCILYIGRGRDLRSLFVFKLMFLVAMENVFCFFFKNKLSYMLRHPPKMPLLKKKRKKKGTACKCPAVLN